MTILLAARLALSLAGLAVSQLSAQAARRDTARTSTNALERHGSQQCQAGHGDCEGAVSFYLEEDNLQSSPSTDRNYTLGFGLSRITPRIYKQGHAKPLDWAERFLSRYSIGLALGATSPSLRDRISEAAPDDYYAELLSGTGFTPQHLWVPEPIVGDRPYAFLLGWTVTRTSVTTSENTAFTSELTLGTIGSRLGRNVQRAIHYFIRDHEHGIAVCDTTNLAATGPCDPKGWGNQIMDVPSLWVGIPTLRYALSAETGRTWSPWPNGSHAIELAGGGGGDAGYYTDAWAGLRTRIGFFDTPFFAWNEAPLSNFSKILNPNRRPDPPALEAFAFGGIRPRAIAFNALLQGYPGYRGYAFGASEIRHTQLEGEVGLSALFRFGKGRQRGVRVTHVFNAFRTDEFRGPLARTHQWGGWYLSTPSAWYPHIPNILQM